MGTRDLLWKYLKRSFAVGIIGAIGVTVSGNCYRIGITKGLPMPPAPNSSISDSEMMAVDVVLVDKCYLQKYELSHGDIAIFGKPGNKNKFVQRIVGLPGDRILTKRYKRVVKVPEGYCLTEGDDSKLSLDMGLVPLDMIRGCVSHILWPPQRMGKVCKVDRRIPQKKFLLYCDCIPSPYSFE